MKKKLKIGFVIVGSTIPAWYAETIAYFIKQDSHLLYFLRFSLTEVSGQEKPSFYRKFVKFEDRWFNSEFDANKHISFDTLVTDSANIFSEIDCGHLRAESDLKKLSNLHLHVIYSIDLFGAENFSEIAEFGFWYTHFGYGEFNNTAIPAFWEVMDNSPVTGSYLLMRKKGVDFILYEGTTLSVPYSVKNNFNSIAWKSASYFPHRVNALTNEYDTFQEKFTTTFQANKAMKGIPSNFQMLSLFIKNVLGYFGYKIKQKFIQGRFTILYAFGTFELKNIQKIKFREISLPKDVFYADPFVVKGQNGYYVFFEEYLYSKGKAHISVIAINKNGDVSEPKIVLDKAFHLSYPFVFQFHGDYYMIPETSANSTVELYKAVDFPFRWEFVRNIIEDRMLIDCTIIFKDGFWWLFANSSNHPFVSTNDQLFLFYSESLFSNDWKSHPMNPIATHAANCRPAGRIFWRNGKLYRPAQNNASFQYGFGIKLNEIEVLTTHEYKEKEVQSIDPNTLGLKATHNIDVTEDFVVIDGIIK